MEDCELEFLPEALQKIAKLAMQRKTGARGLRTIMEDILLDTMYEMPSDLSHEKTKKVTVTQKFVENKSRPFLVFSTENDESSAETAESENTSLLASSE
jgi:ATP-dependent Clp protease ATP-binding subunit ClpX